jgi:hypothetical protein
VTQNRAMPPSFGGAPWKERTASGNRLPLG